MFVGAGQCAPSQSLESGEIAELDQLERGAPARRHVIHAVGELHLPHRRRAVSPTHDGEARAIRDGFGDGAGSRGEGFELEHAHRPVPQHRCRARELVGVGARGLRTDVESLPAVGNRLGRYVTRVRAGAHLLRGHDVGRDRDLAGFEQLAAVVDLVVLDERVADVGALRRQEGERHRAADQQPVAAVEQRVDHAELVADLHAPEHDDERPLRRVEQRAQHLDLARQQPARGRRQHARRARRSTRAARCAAPNASLTKTSPSSVRFVAKAGSFASSPGSNRRFSTIMICAGLEAAATARPPRSRPRPGASGTSTPSSSPSRSATGASEYLRIGFALRATEMRAAHDLAVPFAEPCDRRERGGDAQIVLDLAVAHRRVEVGAEQARVCLVDSRRSSSCGTGSTTGGLLAEELDEVDEAVRVAPLVVVPAEHLHHAARSPSCRATRRCTTPGCRRCRPTPAARRCTRARRGSWRRSDAATERVVDRVDVDVCAAASRRGR